jgi:hypothetical protein
MKFSRGLLLFCLLLAVVPSKTWSSETSLSLDVLGSAAGSNAYSADTGAYGFSLFGDWRPDPAISFGIGAGYMRLGGWDLSTSWVDLGGRLYPLKPFSFGEMYLQGSMGANPLHSKDKAWKGRYHGNVALGLRCPLSGNRSLDLGVGYDLFSPELTPLNSIGLKAGLCWTFGKGQESGSNEGYAKADPKKTDAQSISPAPVAQVTTTVTADPVASPTVTDPNVQLHTWVAGDNLRALAKATYGERDLYPIIVDANTDHYRRPSYLVPGVVLKIPLKVTAHEKSEARVRSHQDGYKLWGRWGEAKK